jgi:hypothetical protein
MSQLLVTRELALLGDTDPELKALINKPLIAKSECKFTCPSETVLQNCVKQLRISDEHLRSRPEELMLWSWNATYIERVLGEEGGTVILGVNWYDLDFFNKKRDSYVNPSHLEKYLNIGFSLENLSVSHWLSV